MTQRPTSRRTILHGTAWSVPAIAAVTATASASQSCTFTLEQAAGNPTTLTPGVQSELNFTVSPPQTAQPGSVVDILTNNAGLAGGGGGTTQTLNTGVTYSNVNLLVTPYTNASGTVDIQINLNGCTKPFSIPVGTGTGTSSSLGIAFTGGTPIPSTPPGAPSGGPGYPLTVTNNGTTPYTGGTTLTYTISGGTFAAGQQTGNIPIPGTIAPGGTYTANVYVPNFTVDPGTSGQVVVTATLSNGQSTTVTFPVMSGGGGATTVTPAVPQPVTVPQGQPNMSGVFQVLNGASPAPSGTAATFSITGAVFNTTGTNTATGTVGSNGFLEIPNFNVPSTATGNIVVTATVNGVQGTYTFQVQGGTGGSFTISQGPGFPTSLAAGSTNNPVNFQLSNQQTFSSGSVQVVSGPATIQAPSGPTTNFDLSTYYQPGAQVIGFGVPLNINGTATAGETVSLLVTVNGVSQTFNIPVSGGGTTPTTLTTETTTVANQGNNNFGLGISPGSTNQPYTVQLIGAPGGVALGDPDTGSFVQSYGGTTATNQTYLPIILNVQPFVSDGTQFVLRFTVGSTTQDFTMTVV